MTNCTVCGNPTIVGKDYFSGRTMTFQEIKPAYRDLADSTDGELMVSEIVEEKVYVLHAVFCEGKK